MGRAAVLRRPRTFTTSEAARFLQTTYQRIMYAKSRGWLTPEAYGGADVYEEEDLRRYARKRGLEPVD